MTLRTASGLALIALGAILAFAVKGHPSFLNIQVVGWVIILTGLAGMLVPRAGYAAVRRRIVRRRPAGGVVEVDERRYPPYIRLNPNALTAGDDPADLVASSDDLSQSQRPERVETVEEYYDTEPG